MTATQTSPYAAPTLKCDIVMKGGITSGVIYPRAVSELAKTYRLSQVGGASAGAIAAAAAAAAELGRHSGGFEEIDRMPDDLAAVGPGGQSTLASFFQPTKTAAPLFRVLFAASEAEGGKAGAIARSLLGSYWRHAAVGALPGLLLVLLSLLGSGVARVTGVVGGLLLLLLGAAVGVALGALRTFGNVAEEGFGMCTGMPGEGADGAAPLTPWLTAKLQSLAGRGPGAHPLTFGDLRDGGVTLRMMTTNLSRHQPMAMPWSTDDFYFDPDEFRQLFPADVVDWMVAHPPSVAVDFDTRLRRAQAGKLRPWPAADDLPVIVATRMSLSFPVLISAVRLWAVDFTQPSNWQAAAAASAWRRANPEGTLQEALAELAPPTYSPVWFSDGGLCANLPVHFFDSPLPKHPTFALNLAEFPPGREKSPDQAENSYLPTSNAAGQQRQWYPLPTSGLGAWGKFAGLLLHTAREWVDSAQLVMPGYRDRIVTVHHDHSEGGMNLAMPPKVVTDLAERGRQGAVKLVAAFAGDQPGVVAARGWDNHRWIRFRTSAAGLAGWLTAWHGSYVEQGSGGTPYPDLAGPGADAPLPSYRLGKAEREAFNAATGQLAGLADAWSTADIPEGPNPAPRLRLVPDDGTAAGLDVAAGPKAPPAIAVT